MTRRPLRILHVNTTDIGGGAEGSAWNLCRAFRERGHESWVAVGRKRSDDPNVLEIPVLPLPTLWGKTLQLLRRLALHQDKRFPAARRVARWFGTLADPQRRHDWRHSIEDFNFPGSHRVADLPPVPPDLIHCHNLHGWYFDLRILPELSRRLPVIVNLRDAWLLTGHCAQFFECPRWETGCGECPDLSIYPGIRRDATAANWQRKAAIYAASRLYVTAPSQWLLDCVQRSMLKGVAARLIPNGIDLRIFRAGDRQAARRELGLPAEANIVLFSAAAARRSVFKDYWTMRAAVAEMAGRRRVQDLVFVCLGTMESSTVLRSFQYHRILEVPFQPDPRRVATYYQAAYVYIHAVKSEVFGKSITEAMASGVPVVATNVGGIPEQVIDGQTGFLVPLRDANALADRTEQLLLNAPMRAAFGQAAARRGGEFSLDLQAERFLAWYEEILAAEHR